MLITGAKEQNDASVTEVRDSHLSFTLSLIHIYRYAQNRGIDNKEYGYMLRGALIGYTAFPKTFTDALYTKTDIYIPMDEYLTAIHKQVETQYPCD